MTIEKPKIGISAGDPNGVGYEVILKTLQHEFFYTICTPILYGNPKILNYTKKHLGLDSISYNSINDVKDAKENKLNLIATSNDSFEVKFGESQMQAGKESFLAINKMMADIKNKNLDAIVTAPVDKSNIKIEQGFSGHTGFITQYLGLTDSLMILYNEEIKIGLVTEHIPLSQVASHLTTEKIFQKISIAHQSLKDDFGIVKPRIAVLSLNPHNGDNGTMGNEEKTIILPAIKKATEQNIICFGTYSADGFFGSHLYKQFDLVLAMYHDQGLVPFKTIAFDEGINYTAGLPIVRTSPDHGTGYNIAGKNIASPLSFSNALCEAIKILNTRKNSEELHKNPLAYTEFKREKFRLEL